MQRHLELERVGVEAGTTTHNITIDAYAKHGDPTRAEDAFRRMLGDGIEANVVPYATVINARAKPGEEDAAACWRERMIAAGVEPSRSLVRQRHVSRGERLEWLLDDYSNAGAGARLRP